MAFEEVMPLPYAGKTGDQRRTSDPSASQLAVVLLTSLGLQHGEAS
jgi:hypothetical protein